jgi:hypothetical protein
MLRSVQLLAALVGQKSLLIRAVRVLLLYANSSNSNGPEGASPELSLTSVGEEPLKLLNVKEAAALSGMSVAWWRQRIFRREVRFYRISRRVFIALEDVEALIKNSRVPVEWQVGDDE